MEVNGQLHALAVLHNAKQLMVHTEQQLCGLQNRSGRDGEEKKYLSLPEI
jgi:hypothetical protein